MNIVCLNCEKVVGTVDPRKKFCDKVCRNRFNVRKSSQRPKVEKPGIDALRAMVRGMEAKKRVSAAAQTYQKDEWIDP